jgi:tungstate transport system substrate-binding protein
LPRFAAKTGIEIKVVAVGTGQASDIGKRGDADVVFVHDRPAEDRFMAEGFGVKRFDVMYNDFVVLGPSADPAHIAGGKNVVEAFRKIADEKAPNPAQDRWYREIGQRMGPANMAASANAYVLSDRGTWLSFKNRGTLEILVEGTSGCSTNTGPR